MSKFVSIVIVSHSEKIASGVKELIKQITEDVTVEVAGGTDHNEIGTSLTKIKEAIERARSSQGTLVFYDMGSAKMNVQFAVEVQALSNVEIVDAPLIEGAYIAAVKASIGKSATEIKEKLDQFFPHFTQDI